MSNESSVDAIREFSYPTPHLAWLACLGLVLRKVRSEGLMSIEMMVDEPERPGSLFKLFPQVFEQPYLAFATDLLRMAVGGNLNVEELSVYADHAIAGFVQEGADASLLKAIWLTLWAATSGYSPQSSCEFGRQAIPAKVKPSFLELEQALREVEEVWRKVALKDQEDLGAEVDALFGSIDRAMQ